MKQNPGGHKSKEDSELGTAIDTVADKNRRSACGNRGIENIVRRCDELSGFARRRAMWERSGSPK
jgi:hypothetical protein